MAKRKNYYAVIGSNGFGIVNSWEKVCRVKRYFSSFNCHGFFTYEDAYKWLEETFCRIYTNGNYQFPSIDEIAYCGLIFIKNDNNLRLKESQEVCINQNTIQEDNSCLVSSSRGQVKAIPANLKEVSSIQELQETDNENSNSI